VAFSFHFFWPSKEMVQVWAAQAHMKKEKFVSDGRGNNTAKGFTQ
jgi:hypothetical protein